MTYRPQRLRRLALRLVLGLARGVDALGAWFAGPPPEAPGEDREERGQEEK